MRAYVFVALLAIFACQVLSQRAQDCTPLRCTRPVKPGNCNDRITSWYFDNNAKQCRVFIYTGCGGNVNRFRNKQLCENTCFRDRPNCGGSTTTTLRPGTTRTTRRPGGTTTKRPLPPRCNLKLDPGNCNKKIPRIYYDSAAVACKPFNYTGCRGNVNNFGTMELCEKTCLVA